MTQPRISLDQVDIAGLFIEPGGRLTLSSGVPVMTSDVTAATTVYYTPAAHNGVFLYNGTAWDRYFFTELSQTLADTSKSPAATTADNNYDMFVWYDSGTLRCTRGPAWSSATARGTGAGTTELERVSGVWLNKVAITNGPAAQRGLYVGTIRTTSANQVTWEIGGTAAGGDPAVFYVYNYYHQQIAGAAIQDSTDSWTYASSTIRASNASNNNRASFVFGMAEDVIFCTYNGASSSTGGAPSMIGLGLDSTTAIATGSTTAGQLTQHNAAHGATMVATYVGYPGLGYHFVQALECSPDNTSTITFYGDNGDATRYQTGMTIRAHL